MSAVEIFLVCVGIFIGTALLVLAIVDRPRNSRKKRNNSST